MGLEGVLLGAHAEGVRNILAVTGDPPHVGDYPGSRGVYEIDAIGLVQLLSRLNEGVDYVGKAIDRPTSFFIGVAVNPSADDPDLELERFERKVDAGARFAMTQALFDLEGLERFLTRLGGTSPIPLLAGVWPLRSHAMALRLHNEVPGISVPAAVLDALRDAGPDAPAVGFALARDLARRAARPRRRRVRDPAVQAARGGARPAARPRLTIEAGRLERARAGMRECRSHDVRRHAVAAVGPRAAREHGRQDRALRVDDGAARVAAANRAANGRDPPARGEVPVGVAADDPDDTADAHGRLGVGAVARIAEEPGRCPLDRIREPKRSRMQRRHAQHGDVVRPVERRQLGRRAGRRRSGRRAASSTPATTCAFVTTSPSPATQPEPSMPSPQAVPTTRTTLSAAAVSPGASRTEGSGAATPAAGPTRTEKGSMFASASITRVGGNSSLSVERMLESRA